MRPEDELLPLRDVVPRLEEPLEEDDEDEDEDDEEDDPLPYE